MSAFATHQDLVKRWKGFDLADADLADQLLEDASVWLRAWFPCAQDLTGASLDLVQSLVIVACAMVKRALLNGDSEGQTSSSETVGPFQYQVAYRNPEGNLYVTKQEEKLIDSACGLNTSGAVSMTAQGL